MYWRLLSSDPAATREIVLAEKPPISTETDRMDKGTLDQVSLHVRILVKGSYILEAPAAYGNPLEYISQISADIHSYSKGSIFAWLVHCRLTHSISDDSVQIRLP